MARLTRLVSMLLSTIVMLAIGNNATKSESLNNPNGLTSDPANNNNNNEQLTSSTLAIVPLQVFPKGSVKLADLEQILARVNSQAPIVNSSAETRQTFHHDNRTIENHIRSRERLKQERLLNIQAQILQRLGLSGRNPVTPPSSSHSRSMSLFPSATTLVNRDNTISLARKLLNLANSSADINNSNKSNNYFEDLLSAAAPDGVTNTGSQQNQQDYSTSEFYAQRLQSFYPSCSAPNETDESSWRSTNGRQMRLHFEVNIPRSHNVRTHVTIMWAKLRLYLFAAPGCATNRIGTSTDTSTYLDLMVRCETSTVTISLFQYMRPLRPNRKERRRMLDSRTVPSSYRGSIEFNMQSVINYWQNMPDRNYGLAVMVEDAFGKSQQPTQFLRQMNCSDSDVPLPNLAELYNYNHNNRQHNPNRSGAPSSPSNNNNNNNNRSSILPVAQFHYPTLDLMTMETVLDQNGPPPLSSGSTVSFLATTIFQSPSSK